MLIGDSATASGLQALELNVGVELGAGVRSTFGTLGGR
jgi:hypothetical protein